MECEFIDMENYSTCLFIFVLSIWKFLNFELNILDVGIIKDSYEATIGKLPGLILF